MEEKKRRRLDGGATLSVKALTAFIIIGIILLVAFVAAGYIMGNKGAGNIPASAFIICLFFNII